MISKKFEIEKTVQKKHLDDLNHVNNVQYLYWVQEVSQAHWDNLINKKKILEKGLWVVRSHKIEYKNLTKLNDKIIISTYVKNVKGYLSERSVVIKLKKTEKILVKCLTEWCFIDLKTQKLKKIPQEIIKLFNDIN
ncbi:MAG: thioesterase [Flavobacteriaceae bacterium]|nr:thioesterase [Flavobacteriaceae bacterium]|tara:strand:- start:32828 stop:33235 length:408 start_codon:yes stop_codon:yes gene_type:complete